MSGLSQKERYQKNLAEKNEIIRDLIRMYEGKIEKNQSWIDAVKMLVGA